MTLFLFLPNWTIRSLRLAQLHYAPRITIRPKSVKILALNPFGAKNLYTIFNTQTAMAKFWNFTLCHRNSITFEPVDENFSNLGPFFMKLCFIKQLKWRNLSIMWYATRATRCERVKRLIKQKTKFFHFFCLRVIPSWKFNLFIVLARGGYLNHWPLTVSSYKIHSL